MRRTIPKTQRSNNVCQQQILTTDMPLRMRWNAARTWQSLIREFDPRNWIIESYGVSVDLQ